MAASAAASPSSTTSLPGANAPGLPSRRACQAHVARQVVDGLVPIGDERLSALADPVEGGDVVLGEHGPAARHERAVVGIGAVRAGRDIREGPLDRRAEPLDLGGDAGEERLGLVRNVGAGEEILEVRETCIPSSDA